MSIAVLTAVVALLMAPQRLPVQLGDPDARIVGQVIDKESRAPLPDATVMLTLIVPGLPAAATGPFQAVTDANGRFQIGGIVPGTYHVMTGMSSRQRAASMRDGSDGVRAGVTGGVLVTGSATSLLSSPGMTAVSLEITVGDTDVIGLRIVVPGGK